MAVYLSRYQLVPYDRSRELLTDLFGHATSRATLVAANHARTDHLVPVEEETPGQIRLSLVAHFDKTGIRVDGQLPWLHTSGTATATVCSP